MNPDMACSFSDKKGVYSGYSGFQVSLPHGNVTLICTEIAVRQWDFIGSIVRNRKRAEKKPLDYFIER
jgi:hypothetical protein